MRLARGQLPLKELLHIAKAHDVRTLRVCGSCGDLGSAAMRYLLGHRSAP